MPELVCLVGWLAIGSLETVEHSPFCYIWASSKICRMILLVLNYQHKSLPHGSSVNNVLHTKPGLSGSLDCTGILCKHLCIFTLLVGLLFPLGVQYAEIRAL
jgi:fumarate reductase subunit D